MKKPGYEDGGSPLPYTGDNGKEIVADEVSGTEKFDLHKGEFVSNAPLTALNGGPDEVERVLIENAKKNIAAAGEGQPQIRPQLPIVSKHDSKIPAPFNGTRPGYAGGGTPEDPYAEMNVGKWQGMNKFEQQDWLANTPGGDQTVASFGTANKDEATIEPTTPGPIDFTDANQQVVAAKIKAAGTDTGKQADVYKSALDAADAWTQAPTGQSAGPAVTPPVKPTAPAPLSGTPDIDRSLDRLRQTAAGKNPLLDSIINQTLQKHGANTAAGKAELQMRLGQQGITGPAADAAMETFDRNSRLGRSQIETSLAQEGMQQATAANKDLLAAGKGERSFAMSQAETSLATLLQNGQFDQYKALYKQTYGIDIDPTAMQQAYGDSQIKSIKSGLYTDLAANPALTLNDVGVRDRLTRLYQLDHPGQNPDDVWMGEQLTQLKNTTDPAWQYGQSLTPERITNEWFGGDSAELAKFKWGKDAAGNPLVGEKAFRAYLPTIFQRGGIKMVTDPTSGLKTFTVDFANPVFESFMKPETPTTVITGPITAVGTNQVKIDGKDYTVVSGTQADPKTVSIGDEVYNVVDGGLQKVTTDRGKDAAGNLTFRDQPVMMGDKPVVVGGTAEAPTYTVDGKPVSVDFSKYPPTVTSTETKVGGVFENIKPSLGAQGNVVMVTSGSSGQIGQDDKGQYFLKASNGDVSKYGLADLVNDAKTWPTTTEARRQYSDIMTQMAKNAVGTEEFKEYLVKNPTPNPMLLGASIKAGDPAAINYGIGKVIDGSQPGYYTYPAIKEAIDKKASSPVSVSGSRYLINPKDLPGIGGFIKRADGKTYYVKSLAERVDQGDGDTAFGDHQVYSYPYTVVDVSTGKEMKMDIFSI
jgi:hypothetical protein